MPDSLIHPADGDGPGLHALIIGVGDYPHLAGGGGALFAGHEGMGQLTSAPASAVAIADWLLRPDGYHHPHVPLRTVRMLLSQRSHEGADGRFRHPVRESLHEVPPATLAEVERAVDAWIADLNGSESNRALFFFSGHGVSAGLEQWLLLSDFGVPGRNPYEPAIRFSGFHLGMASVAAREQLYFLDACRSHSDEAAATFGNAGTPIVGPNPRARFGRERQPPVFNATLKGAEAFGRRGQPSFFTEAVLEALKGGGSDDSDADGRWKVETNTLNRVVQWLIGRTARRRRLSLAQINSGIEMSSLYFSYLQEPPLTPVGVDCEPEDATAKAVFGAGDGRTWCAADRDPLLPLGEHRFTAEFADGSFRRGERPRDIRPPYREVRIPVDP